MGNQLNPSRVMRMFGSILEAQDFAEYEAATRGLYLSVYVRNTAKYPGACAMVYTESSEREAPLKFADGWTWWASHTPAQKSKPANSFNASDMVLSFILGGLVTLMVVCPPSASAQDVAPPQAPASVPTEQPDMDIEQRLKKIEHMMPRTDVYAILGEPTRTRLSNGKRIDTYVNKDTSVVHGIGCAAAAIATMGLGIVFCDGMTKVYTTTVEYTDNKVTSFSTKKGNG